MQLTMHRTCNMAMWNIKIRCPKESDGDGEDEKKFHPDCALEYFDLNKDYLIVREKGKEWHWHVHGTPAEEYVGQERKVSAALGMKHPDRKKNPTSRPISIATGKDEMGFQYIMKNGLKAVTNPGLFETEDLERLHKESQKYRADKTSGSRKRAKEVDIAGLDYVPAAAKIMRSVLDHSVAEGKMLPMQARQIVLTDLYTRGFKDEVIKSMLKL